MANVFVNPGWISVTGGTAVYFTQSSLYKDSGEGRTQATCYSTLEEAVTGSSSGGTIYIYNSTASPLSLLAPSGTYSQQLSSAFFIEKNLYVWAGIFQVGSVEHHTYSFNIIGNYTVDFGVAESFNIAQNTIFNVWDGANFQLGSTGSGTSVSFENSGTVCVSNGATFQAGNTSITNNVEIEVTGSAFSVASVTNTDNGTFTVEGTSKLEIGNLSGTITLNNENVTLNASSITGGNISATAYGAIFTGANTLNGVTLNATGKTVTVGNTASLTVNGTSTLNIGTLSGTIKTGSAGTTLTDSSITGGSISAQDDLTFTGANTLNGISLDAMVANKTVTIGTGEGDSLTVGGMSTLNIGTLDGEIKTAASTTLQNSSITGGGANGGTITAQGAITVNNSTITSSKFTAITVNGVDFTGANTLDGVTLETGTSMDDGYVYIDTDGGTLTIKGKSTLKTLGLLGTRTIKLDGGAEIVDSRIVGNNGAGGTLVVESGKTATFSTTGSNSNDFGRTSFDNSGTINVNGLLSLSTTTGTINNSGTINVNGTLSTGTIDNTSGTIALNGGATVASAISGGSITTSNTGTVTVQYSTISSSAFTATADEVIFYYRNTLNGVTLDATGKAVTVNGTLTVKGTSTLNATNITGGTISAQDNLTFTGTNTLKNGVTLDATGMTTTVTIGNDDEIADSLTVEGTNTLNIGTLNGTILTDSEAATTLNASSITGGTISAQNNLAFTGANTLNGITLDATDRTVTVGTGNSDSLIVGGTSSTLNIGTLDGTIKTSSAGTTLNASSITGGGTNGGTITALGTLTFANNTHLRNITLDAHDQTVDTGSSYSFWLGGAITLKIGNLISSILLGEDTTFTNSTISNGNNSSRLFIYGGKVVTFAGANTIFDAKVHATGTLENVGGSITVKSNDDKGKLTVYWIKNSGNITVGSAGSANEAADACSLTGTLLNNGGTITVNGENQNNRSLLDAAYITNGDNDNHTGMMSLTNSELNATRLENYGRGEFDPGPPKTSQAAITISASTVSIKESLTNGAANNTSATIEFNNSTVTADSVTNYGFDNGTGGNTGKTGFVVNDSTFTVNGTFTNLGKIDMTGVTLQAASVVTSDRLFRVYGTSTLDIDSLEGTIMIANPGNYETPITLTGSTITGKVENGNRLGIIDIRDPLTFTGANTLTNISVDATANYGSVTVRTNEGDSLTMKGISSLRTASLNGTILTDTAAATTLTGSTITGGGTNGGTITAQNDLTFSGENTLRNISLDAADQTVTVGSGATLTVGGTSTLNIGTLDGTILTDSAATTTLNSSSITGGTISAQNSLAFTGANTLNGVTLTATGKTITNTGTLTVDALSTITASAVSGGVLDVTTDGLGTTLTDDLYIVVNGTITGDLELLLDSSIVLTPDSDEFIDVRDTGYQITTLGGKGVFLLKKGAPSTLYVSNAYPTDAWSVTDDGHLVGYNAFSSVDAATAAAQESGSPINLENGTYTEITQLRGAMTVIQEGTGTTEFTKAVYGGTKVDATDSVTRNTDVTIKTGTFDRFFVGGNNIAMPTTTTTYTVNGTTQSVAVSGGTFNAIVATADRVQMGAFTLNSDLEMNISGGQFNYFVAGGLLNSLYEKDGEVEKTNGTADIYGDVSLNITGGAFADDCWIYGGCISTSRSVSSYASTIYGDVTVTIDCGDGNEIQLSHLTAGSHGLGQIKEKLLSDLGGNTAIVFKGIGSNLSFTANGELWGGSGRDNVHPTSGKCMGPSLVKNDRLLSFEGFTGNLNCKKIRDFSSIQLIGKSAVNLTETTVDLNGIENWTFECDSSLSGVFGNDFTGDTLNLNGFADLESGTRKTLMTVTDGDGSAFSGFHALDSESLLLEGVGCVAGSVGDTDLETRWYWGTSEAHTFELYLQNNETSTSMILAKC